MAKSEFKSKNQNFALGLFWRLVYSFTIFVLLWLVFSRQLGRDIPYYPAYLFVGVITFNFFVTATGDSAAKFLQHGLAIKSIKFPALTIIASGVVEALMANFLEIMALAAFSLIVPQISLTGIALYFIALLPLLIFTFGVALGLSTLCVFWVDIVYLWRFFTFLLWFATPIFYFSSGQKLFAYLNSVNPIYGYVSLARQAVIYNRLDLPLFGLTAAWAVFAVVVAFLIYRALWPRLVEKV